MARVFIDARALLGQSAVEQQTDAAFIQAVDMERSGASGRFEFAAQIGFRSQVSTFDQQFAAGAQLAAFQLGEDSEDRAGGGFRIEPHAHEAFAAEQGLRLQFVGEF
jgi:hypothetical protein